MASNIKLKNLQNTEPNIQHTDGAVDDLVNVPSGCTTAIVKGSTGSGGVYIYNGSTWTSKVIW